MRKCAEFVATGLIEFVAMVMKKSELVSNLIKVPTTTQAEVFPIVDAARNELASHLGLLVWHSASAYTQFCLAIFQICTLIFLFK